MTRERYQRVVEIFQAASERSANARPGFLTSACGGDDDLRRDVEAMLAADAQPGGFLSKSPDDLAAAAVGARETRSLIGQRVSHYEVISLLGAGGMGEVYRARDTRLKREVALKVLPDFFANDPERMARFQREAEVLAALNHPNIAAIYGIEDQALVMELVEGPTLADRMAHGLIPIKEVLSVARQISDALQAAHEKGIIHRDLKPANIKVTKGGIVKVLDFGLATVTMPATMDADNSASLATATMRVTQAGMIIGTPVFMSPEQAQGKETDARSDIFAFGALLYQLVTGRPAFPGKNVISVLAAVINQDPPPIGAIVGGAPPELEWVIKRCLSKDPDRRMQHIVDVKIALEETQERISSLPMPVAAKQRGRVWLTAITALLVGIVPSAWLGERIFRKGPITVQRITFRRGDVLSARFAPAGAVVYAAEYGAGPTLFSAQPGSREDRDVGLPSASAAAVSPSGELAVLLGASNTRPYGTLARVGLAGGIPRPVAETVWSADWGPDGTSLAVVRTINGHHRVEYPIGTVLYDTPALRAPVSLRVSPKGDRVTFFEKRTSGDYSLNVVDTQGHMQVLSRGWLVVGGGAWSPDGKEIWFGGGRTGADPAVYAVDLFAHERMLTQTTGALALYDIAPDGRVLLANVDSRIGIQFFGPDGKGERDLAWLDTSALWDISQDGKQILFLELSSGQGGNPAIYIRGTDGSPAVRLGYGHSPSLSPDGKWVVCVRVDREASRLVLLPTGPGEERTLLTNGIQPERAEWFPDGKRLLFSSNEVSQQPRSYVLDLTDGTARPVTAPGTRASAISPDSQYATFTRSGKLYLLSLGTGQETLVGPVDPDAVVIRWSVDGQYLFLQRNDSQKRTATIQRIDVHNGRREVWREVKTLDPTGSFFGIGRLTPDGKSCGFSFQRDLATLYVVKGLR